MNSIKSDTDHVPCVIECYIDGWGGIWKRYSTEINSTR